MSRAPGRWPWRLSLVLAALLIVRAVSGLYDTWRQMQLTELMFPGTVVRPDWSRIGLVVLIGVVIPATWLAIAWAKAFPHRS